MTELEKIEENTLKKSISMYKINQMMEQEAREEEQRALEERQKPVDPKQVQKDGMQGKSKGLMSDQNRRHFKQLTSFINAYRMKMTQSSSNSAMARAIAAMSSSKRDNDGMDDGFTLEQINQLA